MQNLTKYKLNYLDILSLYFPLLINTAILALSPLFINYGLSKSENIDLSLATFTTSFSVMVVINSITLISRKVFIPHLSNLENYLKVKSFFIVLAIISSFLYLLIAITPVGSYVFEICFHLPKDISFHSKQFMLIMVVLPFLMVYRSAYQGIVTVYKRTSFIVPSTLIRLFSSMLFIILLIQLIPNNPGLSSALAFILGISFETLFLFFVSLKLKTFKAPTFIKELNFKLTNKYLIKFTFPMLMSSFAVTVSFPVINYMIGFTGNVKDGLACFGILRNIFLFVSSSFYSFSTIVLVLGNNRESMKLIRRFFCIVVAISTISLLVIVAIGAQAYLFEYIYNFKGILLEWLNKAFVFIVPIPIIHSIRCYIEGTIIKERETNVIGYSAIFKTIVIILSGSILLNITPNINGAILGAILLNISGLSETLFLIVARICPQKSVLHREFEF